MIRRPALDFASAEVGRGGSAGVGRGGRGIGSNAWRHGATRVSGVNLGRRWQR